MKIVRYFIHTENEETGIGGFVPLWIPKSAGFDPLGPSGMAHDLIEHRLCDTGTYEDELMAFGRLIAIRGINNVILLNRFNPDVSESLGAELAGIWDNHRGNHGSDLKAAPGTGLVDDSAETFIRKLVKKFAASVDYEDEHDALGEAHLDNMRCWLRIGYMDACRRYGEVDHGCYDIGMAMERWGRSSEASDLRDLEEEGTGSALRLCFDTKSLRFTYRLYRPNDEYGQFPAWLRARIYKWRTT